MIHGSQHPLHRTIVVVIIISKCDKLYTQRSIAHKYYKYIYVAYIDGICT